MGELWERAAARKNQLVLEDFLCFLEMMHGV